MGAVAIKNARAFRHRVQVVSIAHAIGASGDTAETVAPVADAWASIEPITLRTQERVGFGGSQILAEATHVVRMRPTAGLTVRSRIVWGARVFEVLSVANVQERGVLVELLCQEAV